MSENHHWKELVNNEIPPYVMRFVKQTGKAINRHEMIKDKDSVLLSVSGGKDSLALAFALATRLKWLPISYNLKAVLINWLEHPIADNNKELLKEFFEELKIDLTIIDEQQFSDGFNGEFNCYLCSRNRRRILFDYADKHNYKLIAMGHHLDDLVETSLLNLSCRGTFTTMLPVQEFFKGKLHIIRPMIEIHEQTIKNICTAYKFPVVKPICPYDETNIRSRIKPIVKELVSLDRFAREHIYEAHNFSYKIEREKA